MGMTLFVEFKLHWDEEELLQNYYCSLKSYLYITKDNHAVIFPSQIETTTV